MPTARSRNLMARTWFALDPKELRMLLAAVFGEPGQYDGVSKSRLYLPLAGSQAQVILDFKGSRIARICPGPAFDQDKWANFVAEVESGLMAGPIRVGREISFASQPVRGSWRGERSGIQILPPPEGAPLPSEGMAEHPFLLEFPLRECSRWPITNHRRIRDHERLSNLLNVLLTQRISVLPRRQEHFWACIHEPGEEMKILWVQQFYFAKIGAAVRDAPSPAAQASIAEIDRMAYYSTLGNDALPLRLPQGLDSDIAQYLNLLPEERERFDRAAYWMSMASRQWNISMSLSFTALVCAIEALTVRGVDHRVYCPDCGKFVTHERPGATERFRAFLDRYAASSLDKDRRNQIYSLRSGILHGSSLITLDYDLAHGWDPPWWNERQLHSDLWRVASTALRNWLHSSAGSSNSRSDHG